MDVEIYRQEAEKYKPERGRIKILFIAESPPPFKKGEKPRYFYFKENKGPDLLFSSIIKAVYDIDYRKSPEFKAEFLDRLRDDGYFLIDACEYPLGKKDDRNEHIKKNLPDLLNRMRELRDDSMKIVLIKNSVFEILNEPLRKSGFNVLNKGSIGFPRYYNDRQTVSQIRYLIKNVTRPL